MLFRVALSAVLGALASSVLACVPGLHVYNLLALFVIAFHSLAQSGSAVPSDVVIAFFGGMVCGYALLNTIPSVLLAAPDESALFTVLPGQKYLMAGRGYAACWITFFGGLGGLAALLAAAPFAPLVLPTVYKIVRPHTHWIVWCVIVFMLMSEWPKGGRLGQSGWRKLASGWRSTGVGLVTFLLSGLLGFVLLFRSPVRAGSGFQNLMPAFVGLFTVPWLIMNVLSGVRPPPQTIARYRPTLRSALGGIVAGTVGGGFAAFFPVVTGGVGGMLAGHATAIRDDETFLVSQGASKFVYYVGGYLLLHVPDLWITRGGAAWMLRGLHRPQGGHDYVVAILAVAIACVVSLLMAGPMCRAVLWAIGRVGYRHLSVAALAVVTCLIVGITGWWGLLVAGVATGIGLLPVLYGSRRMNCLGVILLPIACNMSGVGSRIAEWMGLL